MTPTVACAPMKLLITSIGSLVGKNILDVLEYPGLSRRNLVQVVGINSIADAANNFRCDRCYRVPETAQREHGERIRDILLKERPDLILCGRDADTLALAELRTRYPDTPGALPVGTPEAARLGVDKWETWLFSRRHGLPFAESFKPDRADRDGLEAFCARIGYPLIAKPTQGFASRDVHFIRNPEDARELAEHGEFIFQEYLGDPRNLERYFASFRGPPPLHVQPADTGHCSSQTVIGPNGEIAPPFVIRIELEYGHALAVQRVEDAELDELTRAYARALVAEGAKGPVNIAFRRDRHGCWSVQEINLRNTGSTLARLLLGMDELHLIARYFVPGVEFPEMRPAERDRCNSVTKHVTASPIPAGPAAELTNTGIWSRV